MEVEADCIEEEWWLTRVRMGIREGWSYEIISWKQKNYLVDCYGKLYHMACHLLLSRCPEQYRGDESWVLTALVIASGVMLTTDCPPDRDKSPVHLYNRVSRWELCNETLSQEAKNKTDTTENRPLALSENTEITSSCNQDVWCIQQQGCVICISGGQPRATEIAIAIWRSLGSPRQTIERGFPPLNVLLRVLSWIQLSLKVAWHSIE